MERMRNLALHDPVSGLFWDAKAPPRPKLSGRSPTYSKTWKPNLLDFPTQVSEKVASSRYADYSCLRSFRSDLPDLKVVEISWVVKTKEAEIEGLAVEAMMSLLRAHCPETLVRDFSRLARKGFRTLPTHAIKRGLGVGKKVLDEYCQSAVHGSYYSFVSGHDAVTVRLLSNVTIVDLATTRKV